MPADHYLFSQDFIEAARNRRIRPSLPNEFMQCYPRTTACVADYLGLTKRKAATIVRDARRGYRDHNTAMMRKFKGDAKQAVREAYKTRHKL